MNLPQVSFTALLALCFQGSPAMAQNARACHAVPEQARLTVPWTANAGEIRWTANQSECSVETPDVRWVAIAVLPPGSAGQRILQYSIDTNFSPHGRKGRIRLGDASIVVDQAPGPPPGFSYTPGRLEFSYPTAAGARETSQSLFVGSEEPLAFSAKTDAVAWLKVKPSEHGGGARKHAAFQVTVNPKNLKPGSYQANIYLDAEGASNPREVVPVILQVGER